MNSQPHRRLNSLTQEWVLISPQRTQRPWLGKVESNSSESLPSYDPACYLCPGNLRVGGHHNSAYTGPFVFNNDFAALLPSPELNIAAPTASPLYTTDSASGICRVVCFSERHDLTLPQLSQAQITAVVQTWADQTRELGERDSINYVQVFENKGEIMGCSNPHPHSQIWASSYIPNEPAKEGTAQLKYLNEHGTCLLCDYLHQERHKGERIVATGKHFTALVPFWAIWPYEILVMSHRHLGSLTELNPTEIEDLAQLLKSVTTRYDNLFNVSFPYSMGFHQSPTDNRPHPEWHLHAHFYPPLLRSATVKKFMVGYEMLAMPQRDLTPESAAEVLRNLPETDFRLQSSSLTIQ